jgi:hypothetical protein
MWLANFSYTWTLNPTYPTKVHNSHMQFNFPCNIHAKNEFFGGCSNNNFDLETWATSKVCNSRNKDPIVKLGSFGHNSLKYCAYLSSPWPSAIILVKVIGNYPRPNIILLHTCNLGNEVFAWSILSWIMHKNSSFDRTDYVLQIWYKFLLNSWCRICFLSFTSYSRTSLLLFPNLDIKSFRDSQTMHFANIDPGFHTSTFKWCLILNLFIADWEIPRMLNFLFIYHPTNTKNIYIKLSTIDVYLHISFKNTFQFFKK